MATEGRAVKLMADVVDDFDNPKEAVQQYNEVTQNSASAEQKSAIAAAPLRRPRRSNSNATGCLTSIGVKEITFMIHRRFGISCLFFPLLSCAMWAQDDSPELKQQVIELRSLVEKLQARVDELEKRSQGEPQAPSPPAQAANAAPQQ
ncbi:MAG: hypothetical protein JO317_08915, partial [Verrucomicrobiae bacterium]|nr:hypothetical protein [Verrucomicrobiae bacterium]